MKPVGRRTSFLFSRPVGLTVLIPLAAFLSGCATIPATGGRGGPVETPAQSSPIIEKSLKDLGIASPRSLLQAENALGESTAGYSNYGLELSYVIYKMIQIVYPLYLKPEYVIFPPSTGIFPDLFKQVQEGRFPTVPQNDVSFLTLIIPPLAVLYTNKPDVVESSIEALDHAENLNPNSVLPPYLKGLINERKGHTAAALTEYERALSVDSSCYPAAVGKARVLIAEKRYGDAESAIDTLLPTIPPDPSVFRLQAEARFARGSYPTASEAVAKSLQLAPDDVEALILSVRIYEARKNYTAALAELSKAEKVGGATPRTVLLRSRLRRERGDPAAAVEVLAAGLKQFPGNKEISDAYGKLLIETGRAGEGGKYLSQAASHSPHGTDSLELLVTDAIHAKKWKAAAGYVSRLLELKSDEQTLQQAYVIYRALDDTNKVIEYARKLHESAPSNGRYLLEYVRGLMSAGEKTKAKRVIRENLNDGQVPSVMSSLYYLRSEMRSDRALQLQDLRAALFENLENENALIAITRYYIRSGDFRSARTYARQALVFLPSGEQLPSDVAKVLAPGR